MHVSTQEEASTSSSTVLHHTHQIMANRHQVPQSSASHNLRELTVHILHQRLQAAGLSRSGNKETLATRLFSFLHPPPTSSNEGQSTDDHVRESSSTPQWVRAQSSSRVSTSNSSNPSPRASARGNPTSRTSVRGRSSRSADQSSRDRHRTHTHQKTSGSKAFHSTHSWSRLSCTPSPQRHHKGRQVRHVTPRSKRSSRQSVRSILQRAQDN